MKMKKITGFTCFTAFLFSLIFILLFRLLAGMQEEKRQYTILLSLGNLTYDEDFLKTASKIKGLQKIYPVVEIPVTIKINDYTKSTVFSAVDLDAFSPGLTQTDLGNTPFLLLGKNSLKNMKDSNGHTISEKQQKKYLLLGKDLTISYYISNADSDDLASNSLLSHSSNISSNINSNTAAASSLSTTASILSSETYSPCKVAGILENPISGTENEEIYISLSQAVTLCRSVGISPVVTKVLLKIRGKTNLENVKKLFI